MIIAVLVLFAVATLAALFAALIGSQLTQVTRQSDLVALRNIAEAGLRLANEELSYSALGADWRPSATPYQCGDGEVRVEVSYGPIPDQLQSRFLRIVSTAVFPDNPFLRHSMLALKPVLLTDYARFITDRFESNQTAGLGVMGLELNGRERPDYLYRVWGPIRSNTDLAWYGRAQVSLSTTFDTSWRELGMLRDDRIEIAGWMGKASRARAMDGLELIVDGVTRAGDLFNPQTPDQEADYASGFPQWEEGEAIPNSHVMLAELPEIVTISGQSLYAQLSVPRVRPPEIDAFHPDKNTNRYWLLTRDSGGWTQTAEGMWFNVGEHGWGWTGFGGIYIDNNRDIQYNHDLGKLKLNWVRSLGAHLPLGDARDEATTEPPEGPADWWDKTGRYYAPPGTEIILHGADACPWVEIVRNDAKVVDGAYYWWQDMGGLPVAEDPDPGTPYTMSYQFGPFQGSCLPSAMSLPTGIYDGNRAVFPFPANGVIYAEGNVRIRGIMPPVRDSEGRSGAAIPLEEAPEEYFGALGTSGRTRRFDLQVVSGGTIYVEGDLLGPGSAGLIPDDYPSDKAYGSRLALLARDYVCVNTTALNPRPMDVFKRVVYPTDPATPNYYNDLQRLFPVGYDLQRFARFRGPENDTRFTNDIRAAYPTENTNLTSVMMRYANPRFSAAWAGASPPDVSLMIGHTALHAPGGDVANSVWPNQGERIEVELAINQPPVYRWGETASRYAFFAGAGASTESVHLYNDQSDPHDYLELLPSDVLATPLAGHLTGDDTLGFAAYVTPVVDPATGASWLVNPADLNYLLGPVAIAPPRGAGPLPVEIEALVYAQNGSWFIIPGPWFNEDPDGYRPEEDLTSVYPGYHEPLNIRLTFYGAITENMPADLGSVAEWTSKWSGPAGQGEEFFLSYGFDPLLRFPRRETEARLGYLRFPNFPITSDLVIWGERVSGPAGT